MDSSENDPSAGPILPSHIGETVQAISRLHARHRQDATGLQRAVETLTRFFSRPRAAALLAAIALAWLGFNTALAAAGLPPADRPPYPVLGLAVSLAALFMTVFILVTQRREDELSELREQLMLELAILSEQKAAKIIQLVEELRRDSPSVHDRHDAEAQTLAEPVDPEAVIHALTEKRAADPPAPSR